MGLAEHVNAGAQLTRDVITLTDTTGTGVINFGATYTILSLAPNIPCRFRLYDDATSRDDATETNRTFPDTNIPASVALIGDFSMSAAGIYSVDPVLFGHAESFTSPLSYYRVEPPGAQIRVTRFLLEDNTVPPTVGGFYTRDNRRLLPTFAATNLPANGITSGSIEDAAIPTTYLLVSASLQTPSDARLRLYAKEASIHVTEEKERPFHIEPSADAHLLVDMILSDAEVTRFSPKIVGANLQNMGNNLQLLVGNVELLDGKQELYYILENLTGSTASVEVLVYVYALEG
jgi:hypothetical protein